MDGDARATRYTLPPAMSALLTDLGVAPADVLRRVALPADLLARAQVTLSPAEYFAFWEAIEQESGDPNLPIAICRVMSVEVFYPPIFAALRSPNLTVAARRIATYKRLIGPLGLLVTESGDATTLELQWPPAVTPPAVLATTELLFWVALARIATRAEVRPLRVTLPEPPEDSAAYRHYLGVAIQPGPAQSIAFATRDAIRPFLTADDGMWQFFKPELDRRLSELDAGASTAERVRAALLELLPAGESTIEAAARHLAVSTRTLQRRLAAERTTFQSVLSTTRKELAMHYLSRSAASAAEIAFLLGYEDSNSFYRAFHAWTGQTPQRVRVAST